MALILSVELPKGGGGKTTVAVNTAAGFARAGWRALLVDCDAQANATNYVAVHREGRPTIADVLLNRARHLPPVATRDAIRQTYLTNLDVIPGHESLHVADTLLHPLPGWERTLSRALQPVQADYDVIVIDTPPNLGTLVVNASVAAQGIIIPLIGTGESLDGLNLLLAKLREWRVFTDSPMSVAGVVRNAWYARERRVERAVLAELNAISEVRGRVMRTVVPHQTVVAEAYRAGVDVAAHAPRSAAAEAFTSLVSEVASGVNVGAAGCNL